MNLGLSLDPRALVLPLVAAVAACAPVAKAPTSAVPVTSATVRAPFDLPLWSIELDLSPPPAGRPIGAIEERRVPAIERWGARFPDAASELGSWIEGDAVAAAALAEWQEAHPEKMRVLVDWSRTHLYESLDAFLVDRVTWDDLRRIDAQRPGSVDAFMAWIRRGPGAAGELAVHRDGMAFAVQHARALAGLNRSDLERRELERAALSAAPAPTTSPSGK